FILAGIILFLFLASRKKYRDASAAPNYEKLREKLTTREIEEEPEEEESYEDTPSFGLPNPISLVCGLVVFGIMIVVGTTILSSLSSQLNAINQTSAAVNATSELTNSLQNVTAAWIPMFFFVMIVGVILITLVRAFSSPEEA